MDRRRTKEKIISHIRETPKEELYVELVEAGMERNKEFEDKHNITITEDNIMGAGISNIKDKAEYLTQAKQNDEPRFIGRVSEIDTVLDDIQYELANLEEKLDPYSSPPTDSESDGFNGELGQPNNSQMDRVIDDTLKKANKLLNRIYNIQERFNG